MTRAVAVVIYADGSGVRSVGEDGGYWVQGPPRPLPDGGLDTLLPANFPPHTPEFDAFLSDLAQVDDVADITAGIVCAMPTFGTTTVLSAKGHTSSNVECIHSSSDEEQAVVDDCVRLTNPPG